MPLLIDCYNVLHAEKPSSLAGLCEASLCGLLARSPWARGGVTVVCDGRPKPHSPDPGSVDGVTLIFSGMDSGGNLRGAGGGRSADDVMIAMIEKDSAPRRLTVVSSDRAIQRAAGRRKARSWSSEAFLKKLALVVERGGKIGGVGAGGKPAAGPMPDEQVDRWLDLFGIDPADAPNSPPPKPTRDDQLDEFDRDIQEFEDEFGG